MQLKNVVEKKRAIYTNKWFDDKCGAIMEKKRVARLQWLRSGNDDKKHKKIRKEQKCLRIRRGVDRRNGKGHEETYKVNQQLRGQRIRKAATVKIDKLKWINYTRVSKYRSRGS